jgi:hypothetical protein
MELACWGAFSLSVLEALAEIVLLPHSSKVTVSKDETFISEKSALII